jgi:hypothetical protein
LIVGVTAPAHELALPPFELEHTLNVCAIVPLFVTLNVTVPVLTVFVDNVNANVEGLPAVTVTTVARVAAFAESTDVQPTTTPTATTTAVRIRFIA